MKRWIFFAILSASFCITSHARLGETFDQCVTRYGQGRYVSGTDIQNYLFMVNDWKITIRFIDNKAECILYEKDGEISNHEIDNLLQFEAARGQWTSRGFPVWTNSSGDTAAYSMIGLSSFMGFFSLKATQLTELLRQREEDNAQAGF